MTDLTPEQRLSDILNSEQLKPDSWSAHIPENAAQALGGIGLGDTKSVAFPKNEDSKKDKDAEEPSSPEVDYTSIIESINSQADVSLSAYSEAMSHVEMGNSVADGSEFFRLLNISINEWKVDGTFDYLQELKSKDQDLRFDLVGVPDGLLRPATIYKFAWGFAKGQSGTAKVVGKDPNIYNFSDLCGTERDASTPRQKVRFSLISSKFIIGPNSVRNQNKALEDIKASRPASAGISVPSVLESIFWWYGKRQQQRLASGNADAPLEVSDLDGTLISHIGSKPRYASNMKGKSFEVVPQTYISSGVVNSNVNLGLRKLDSWVGVRIALGR